MKGIGGNTNGHSPTCSIEESSEIPRRLGTAGSGCDKRITRIAEKKILDWIEVGRGVWSMTALRVCLMSVILLRVSNTYRKQL